ncbi:SubName: Full=Uncharacterized protein {ECO:0000313/EMBL:CCA69126.1} [Serendipita indica DSM 11827]|uniref:FAS1 domain-containing protein n=1 Tax=Serendipita indica (strain DSM 11827) TaxID=1109443 RepID=G4TCU0_SERID|nr:SubName: Full=Uncharacterized protein {ECO:0000313/EMBL:CCA69126.1} [Serendipita indica DSM 11827]CCA69126.1 hypothetical protein PIIN_03026 [Serendipita indica DSM 11827]
MRPVRLFAFLLGPLLVYGSQTPLNAYSTTLVDLLSADADYTQLLRLLQRTRLIPTLNKLNGSTLFAPTNDAVRRFSPWNEYLSLSDDALTDNINEQVRQTLLYHLLNYTLPSFPPKSDVETYRTLHFPRVKLEPPSKDPPPAPPWIPLPGGSLNNESQRLRAASRDGHAYVGVDAYGQSGISTAKDPVNGTNCMLIGIKDVIETPSSLAAIIRDTPSLSYLSKILPESQMDDLEKQPGLTVFLPEDDGWDELHPIIRLYLESPFAHADLKWILGMHMADGKLGYSTRFGDSTKLRTIEGNKLRINVTSDSILVSGAEVRQKDIYASNGVLHTVSNLLLPSGSLQLNAEKYLLALNCSTFVGLLRSVNLTSLVTDINAEYTILAPRDDVLEIAGGGNFPDEGTDELKRSLRYHFIPGKWRTDRLKDGALLETELIEVGLGGARQVLDVGLSSKLAMKSGGKGKKEIYFGGAGVIGEPIEIENTLIYLVSRPLTPPSDVLTTALPSLDLSTYLAAVFSTSLAETVKNLPKTTFLIPTNKAWERLGLVTSYLLMPTSKKDLESVVLHHTLDSVEYFSDLRNGTDRSFRTFEGTDVSVTRPSDDQGDIEVVFSGSGGWDGLQAKLDMRNRINTLTETGVLHQIDTLMIPRSVQVTLGKLVRAAGGGTMASLVTRAGFDWVLNGTAPPEDSEYAKYGQGVGWTLLVPRDEAWRDVNLTKLWDDADAVRNLVTQHLIPTFPPAKDDDKHHGGKKPRDNLNALVAADENAMPLNMYGQTHVTARSSFSSYGQISFMDKGDHFVVGITGARGTRGDEDWAKVMTWGRSTTSTGTHGQYSTKGGVIKIDRVLQPYTPRWWVRFGPPIAATLAVLFVILALGFTARWLYKRKESEPTYEPVGRDEEEDG